MATVPTMDQLVEALSSAARPLNAADQRLAITLYRALGDGEPVAAAELARRTGRNVADVAATLDAWPGVFHDDHGRIIGFWGLALPAMAHRLQIGGRTLHAWCAFDPLFITPLLGEPTRVASRCPVTDEPVSLTVTSDGVTDISPAGAVVSFLAPTKPWDHNVIESFCHYVLYFASQAAGRQWVARHPGTFLLSIEQAFELGRRYDLDRFGAALADAAQAGPVVEWLDQGQAVGCGAGGSPRPVLHEERAMRITLLYFDGCPNWPTADTRLREALAAAGLATVPISYRRVETPRQAQQLGFRGSPTILIDGHDPFATDETPTGLSCRVYQTERGPDGAPSLAQLRSVLAR